MIKAIQTVYNGHRFRSRLEARWAVFFDAMGIKYLYESEGFELENGINYLPDFYLINHKCWIEIKGCEPTETERVKAQLLAKGLGQYVYIFWGGIEPKVGIWYVDSAEFFCPSGLWDNQYAWCQCPGCGKLDIQYNGRAARIKCGCGYYALSNDKGYSWDTPELLYAYGSATQARFEHGETP